MRHLAVWTLALLFSCTLTLRGAAQSPSTELDVDEAPAGGITKEPQEERPYSCPYCNLEGIDLSDRILTDVNFAGANLRNADLRHTVLKGAMLAGADLTGAQLDEAQLEDSETGPANLSRANLTGASFKGADLAGADLQFATLHGTDLSGLDLTAVTFGPRIKSGWAEGRKTSFRGARLRHEFQADAETMDLEGVRWQGTAPAALDAMAADPVIACGAADLSHLDSRIYVSASGEDTATCGTSYSKACRTIEKGIARCAAAGCGVLVSWDEYPLASTVEMRSGIDLYGGCLPESQASPSYFSAVIAAPGGLPAVKARGLSVPTVIQGFQLTGSAAAGSDGAMSVALQVENSLRLAVLTSEIIASSGAPGAPGDQGNAGTRGGNGSGRNGGAVGACSNSAGGLGAVQKQVDTDGSFSGKITCYKKCDSGNNYCNGYAGSPGTSGTRSGGGNRASGKCTNECGPSRGPSGGTGSTGQPGKCGARGAASADVAGRFVGSNWVGSRGAAGTAGGAAGGGGGGGAGSYLVSYCFWVTGNDPGNSGGGGGAGGCGAQPGNGASQGGASFALLAFDSTLDLTGTTIVGGHGGDGGVGGAGLSGGAGGSGAAGASSTDGGYGGAGGAGGPGGGSGGSAGGNGGPAVGVAKVGTVNIAQPAALFYPGESGKVGNGGRGGAPVAGSACTAPDGENGKPGLVADIQAY